MSDRTDDDHRDSGLAGLRNAILITGGVTFAALGIVLHELGPVDTFWTFDNGGKALVLANLREDVTRTWISYPGRPIDPELRYFPIPFAGDEPYAELRDNRVISSYLSPFLWITLPFAVGLGFSGLVVLPALSGGLAVVLTGLLAARLRVFSPDSRAVALGAAAVVAFASPLLFYSSVFWEHTPVVALAAGSALMLVVRDGERPLAAGLLLGAASLLREEALLLLAATGLALLFGRRSPSVILRFAGGGAVGVAALAIVNRITSGTWLGVHVSVNRPGFLGSAGDAADGLLLGTGFSGVSVGWVIGLLGVLAVNRLWPGRLLFTTARRVAAVAGLTAVSVAAVIRFPGSEDQALALIQSNSALVFLPWALVLPFFAGRPSDDRSVFLATIVIAFVGLFLVFVPSRSISGVHPGPRMLLPVLPILAAFAAKRWREGDGPLLLPLLLIGFAWNVRSLEILHAKRQVMGNVAAALADDPRRVVVTNLFWLPTELSPLWSEKQFHLVSGSEDLARLAARAAASGEREITVATVAGQVPRRPDRTVRDARFPAFSVDLHVQRVARKAPLFDLPAAPRRHQTGP
jgi:hypothetical protein